MGFLDKLRSTAKTAVDQHGDRIAGDTGRPTEPGRP
jgi:hypothetical protein